MGQLALSIDNGDVEPILTGDDLADLRVAVEAAIAEQTEQDGVLDPKARIRLRHRRHRLDTWRREFSAIGPRLPNLIRDFAAGSEIAPDRIDPRLELVTSGTRESDLFRMVTMLWSIPVSRGYGRRMRFLVRDNFNGKLIGVFALGDPVFNLRARDEWIGWSTEDRRDRLANVMDAFVVGAVPPYSEVLGGKLVFSLIASREVEEAFAARYRDSTGIISRRKKDPRLALVTVTSALGRSSLYNRLRLRAEREGVNALGGPPGGRRDVGGACLVDLTPIGWTSGYGHFQISDELFVRLRHLLSTKGHSYANGHAYGDGPNWRMRVTRVALQELGLSADFQRHGIKRQVYGLPLALNFREYLTRQDSEPVLTRPSLDLIAAAALRRWVVPRSIRDRRYVQFDPQQLASWLRAPETVSA